MSDSSLDLQIPQALVELAQRLKDRVELPYCDLKSEAEGIVERWMQQPLREKNHENADLVAERKEAIRNALVGKIVQEATRAGLVVRSEEDVFSVGVDGILRIMGGNLAKAYADKTLYSSADMFSPPAERRLHVVRFELTQGCNGGCTYCGGYEGIPYRKRTFGEFMEHYSKVMEGLGDYRRNMHRIFIGGGNALDADQKTIVDILEFLNCEHDPKRISIYGRADSICEKGNDDMWDLRVAGLNLVYMGVESGSQRVLDYVNKNITVSQIDRAMDISVQVLMDLSVMVMPGLGGARFRVEHAVKTAELLNRGYARFITFMGVNPPPKSRYAQIMAQEMAEGKNRPLTEKEVVEQLRETLRAMEPKWQKVGMFGCGIDGVGKSPVRFNVTFNDEGKRNAIGACDRFLRARA
jgi:radical SAM superfamily enzyme YgiQ (UPF0313 family)